MALGLNKKVFTIKPEGPIFQGEGERRFLKVSGEVYLPARQGLRSKSFEKPRLLSLRGFTFIELLVYVATLAVIMLAISSFFLWSNKANTKSKANREVLDNANRVIEIISSEIKEADSIYTPTTVFDSSPGQLSLATTKYLPVNEGASYIDFYLCGTQRNILCMKKESQSSVAITSDRVEVSNLTFKQIATSSSAFSIQINLTIRYKNPNNKPEYQASMETTTTVSLRNY